MATFYARTDGCQALGYSLFMTAAQMLSGPWEDTDATRVVRVLHRSGPTALCDLDGQPELTGWPAERIEHAVVSAWSDNLISIDTRDQLVAL